MPTRTSLGRLSPTARHRAGTAAVLVALGAVATLAQAVEDTASTWSAVYLREELAACPALAGAAFVALQGMQTVGRLAGDRAVTRFGDPAVARTGAAVAGLAIAAALTFPAPLLTVAAFGVAGLGIGTLIPAAMRAADAVPGLPAGLGLTVVGSVARVGSLVAAPAVGVVADATSLRVALVAVPVAGAVLVLLAPALRSREPPHTGSCPGDDVRRER